MYIRYKEEMEEEETNQKKINKRIDNEKKDNVRNFLFKSKGLRERLASCEPSKKDVPVITSKKSTYEIIGGFIISNWDIVIVTALYFAGAYQIDIYHISLMAFFVLFLLYPEYYRINYIYLIVFVHFFVICKYFYVLTFYLYSETTISYFDVIGFTTNYTDQKFFRSNLFNNNWLIVLLSYVQYRTYKSSYYQEKLNSEALRRDRHVFSSKHPRITSFLKFVQDFAYMAVPWITFIIYLANAFLNDKSAINFVIFAYSLFLI